MVYNIGAVKIPFACWVLIKMCINDVLLGLHNFQLYYSIVGYLRRDCNRGSFKTMEQCLKYHHKLYLKPNINSIFTEHMMTIYCYITISHP